MEGENISDRYPDLKIPILRVVKIIRKLTSKAWNKRTTNNMIIQEITGHGNGVSSNICKEIGIKSDAYYI